MKPAKSASKCASHANVSAASPPSSSPRIGLCPSPRMTPPRAVAVVSAKVRQRRRFTIEQAFAHGSAASGWSNGVFSTPRPFTQQPLTVKPRK